MAHFSVIRSWSSKDDIMIFKIKLTRALRFFFWGVLLDSFLASCYLWGCSWQIYNMLKRASVAFFILHLHIKQMYVCYNLNLIQLPPVVNLWIFSYLVLPLVETWCLYRDAVVYIASLCNAEENGFVWKTCNFWLGGQ